MMMRLLIFICLLIVFVNCKRGNHQVVELRNSSSENIYFLVSKNKILTSPNEVAKVRPITSGSIEDVKAQHEDKEQEKSNKQNLYRYQIERDCVETILSSESAEIFVNAISLQSIINDRYNGYFYVFIIGENDLLKYSDQEILDKKLYKHFKTLTAKDIKEDTLTLEYF